MNKKWSDNRKTEKIRILVFIGLTALLLTGLGIAGTIRNGKMVRMSKSQEPLKPVVQSGGHTAEKATPESALTSGDREFLVRLTRLFSQGNLEEAARLLSGYRMIWKEFPCMYDGTVMKAEVSSDRGLVFTKSSEVFYGDFKDGRPKGQCTAIQVLELEEGSRYDYSCGTWENGMMNGEGTCGYDYYDGVTEDITKENVKKGVFKDDLMQGEITYISTNKAGESTTWQFQVSDGVIVPNEKWIKDTDSKGAVSYKLMAKDDDVHAYTLSESAMKENRWKNLIVYNRKVG